MTHRSQHPEDDYARNSFTFRKMTSGQVWSITIVAVIIVAALLAYVWS